MCCNWCWQKWPRALVAPAAFIKGHEPSGGTSQLLFSWGAGEAEVTQTQWFGLSAGWSHSSCLRSTLQHLRANKEPRAHSRPPAKPEPGRLSQLCQGLSSLTGEMARGGLGERCQQTQKGKENRENFVLNVFITSYSRVRCWLFSVLNEVLFLDFQIHTGKLFSSVSAFILYIYIKKYKQQTSKKTLILIAHLLHCFCVISFILSFPYSKKKVPLLLPRLGSCYWRGSRRELLTVCTCCLTAWFRVTGKCWWVKKRLSRQPTHLLVIFLQRRVWQRRVVLFQIRWVQSKCPTDTMLWLILRTGIQSLHYATATNANGSQAAYSLHTALKSNNLRRRVLRQEKWELFINSFVNPSVYEVGIAFHPVPSHDILVSPRTRNGKAGWSFFHVLQLFGAKQLYVAEFQAAFMEGTKLDMHVLSPLLHVQNEWLWRKNAISRQPSECILRKLPW